MSDTLVKNLSVKFIGNQRPSELVAIAPGTTVADVLNTLKLGAGYQLSDAKNSDNVHVFRPDDNLFALVEDGGMVYVSSHVDAGAT